MNGSSIKTMLLGISLMILGLYLRCALAIGGMEFFIVLIGFIISIVGFREKD